MAHGREEQVLHIIRYDIIPPLESGVGPCRDLQEKGSPRAAAQLDVLAVPGLTDHLHEIAHHLGPNLHRHGLLLGPGQLLHPCDPFH